MRCVAYILLGLGLCTLQAQTSVTMGHTAVPRSGAVSGSTTPYTGLVATRTEVPTAFYGGNTWFMDRSYHWTRTAVAAGSMRIVWTNYYVLGGTEGDPGQGTYKAAVEYPAGTITPCTFNGAQTVTVAGLADAITDPCGPAIPQGAMFWVRALRTGGIIFSAGEAPGRHYSSTLDNYQIGQGAPNDQVYAGTMQQSDGWYSMVPAAIVANTSQPAACLAGDSRVKGIFDTDDDLSGDTGELARAVGPFFAYTKLASPGELGSQALNTYRNRQRLLQYCSLVIDEYGINDLHNGQSSSQVAATRTALAGMFALPTYGTTMLSETISADNFSTVANQATIVDARPFNALELAGIPGEIGTLDVASALDPLNLGKMPVASPLDLSVGTGNYVTPDGTHLNSLGNGLVSLYLASIVASLH